MCVDEGAGNVRSYQDAKNYGTGVRKNAHNAGMKEVCAGKQAGSCQWSPPP
jgi:hypothetical protein